MVLPIYFRKTINIRPGDDTNGPGPYENRGLYGIKFLEPALWS